MDCVSTIPNRAYALDCTHRHFGLSILLGSVSYSVRRLWVMTSLRRSSKTLPILANTSTLTDPSQTYAAPPDREG